MLTKPLMMVIKPLTKVVGGGWSSTKAVELGPVQGEYLDLDFTGAKSILDLESSHLFIIENHILVTASKCASYEKF